MREPQAFLMDGPLSNLDAKLRVETRAQLIKLHERLRTTTVYVTHDQVEAMTMGDRIAVMRDGVLQQLDTPQGVYDHPANLFVAGFIGSPAMNIMPMGVAGSGDHVMLTNNGVSLPVPAHLLKALLPYSGQEVSIGIRPEDIQESQPAGQDGAPLAALVEVVEPLGSEAYLYIVTGPFSAVARVGGRTSIRPHESLQMWVNMNHMHAFDPRPS